MGSTSRGHHAIEGGAVPGTVKARGLPSDTITFARRTTLICCQENSCGVRSTFAASPLRRTSFACQLARLPSEARPKGERGMVDQTGIEPVTS